MNQKIRIKLRSYDHNLVDKSTEKIVKTVKNKQFQLRTHKRLIEIYTPNQKTVDALSKLELPSGVDIQVKLT